MKSIGQFRDKDYRAPHFVRLCLLVGLIGFCAAPSLAQQGDRLIPVTIRCDALTKYPGARLTVYQIGGAAKPLPEQGKFTNEGTCHANLPQGSYVFEVLWQPNENLLIALRKSVGRLSRKHAVEFETLENFSLRMPKNESEKVTINEIAIRSFGATGELKWVRKNDSDPTPNLLVAKGQRFRARVFGKKGQQHFAIWREFKSTEPWTILLSSGDLACCRFELRDDGPVIKTASGHFRFPDGQLDIPITDQTELLTNRRFLSFGYSIETEDGHTVATRPMLGEINHRHTFRLGGPFLPQAWAHIMSRKPIDGPQTKNFVWGAELFDQQGFMVNIEKSQIGWDASLRTIQGLSVPDGPLTREQENMLRSSGEMLVVSASYTIDHPMTTRLAPLSFKQYGNNRFFTNAPPYWETQAINYLARAERVYCLIEELEKRPAKHRVGVGWHDMAHTAWGCGSAGGKARITMPFVQLKSSYDYYDEPWALAHEMLHTFGYGHGSKMNEASARVRNRMEQYRWYMADHPEANPNSAFARFRLAVRMDTDSTFAKPY